MRLKAEAILDFGTDHEQQQIKSYVNIATNTRPSVKTGLPAFGGFTLVPKLQLGNAAIPPAWQ